MTDFEFLNANELTILIVDDSSINLTILRQYLEKYGFSLLMAPEGEKGIKLAQLTQPSVILLDVMMAGIDGFETCRRLKLDPRTAEIPVIFMTALAEVEAKVQGFSVGAIDYITKPIQEEELIARISVHLKVQHLTRSLAEKNQLLSQVNQDLEQQVSDRTAQLTQTLEQLQHSQGQLVQSEKMSALGSLTAGIAHEINNPINFVMGNLTPAQRYIKDLFRLLDLYQECYPNPDDAIQEELETIDFAYLRTDLLNLLQSMTVGAERILDISKSLRVLARADRESKQDFNIHDGLESTLLILTHRLKANEFRPAIEVEKHYGDAAIVSCFPGPINQVLMNVLANAIDELETLDQHRSAEELAQNPRKITIATQVNADRLSISIRDNGRGICETDQSQIFDSLFTTKPAGIGTGLGLAIARQIIVDQHQGELRCQSAWGEGTEFVIELPI